jgi:hypothetical protein
LKKKMGQGQQGERYTNINFPPMEMDEIINIKRASRVCQKFFSFPFFFSFRCKVNQGRESEHGWVAFAGKIKFTCFDGAMIPQNGNLIYECENFLCFFFYCVFNLETSQ